ncbi:hypothetical protein ACJX0J_014863 [Zea mays]
MSTKEINILLACCGDETRSDLVEEKDEVNLHFHSLTQVFFIDVIREGVRDAKYNFVLDNTLCALGGTGNIPTFQMIMLPKVLGVILINKASFIKKEMDAYMLPMPTSMEHKGFGDKWIHWSLGKDFTADTVPTHEKSS